MSESLSSFFKKERHEGFACDLLFRYQKRAICSKKFVVFTTVCFWQFSLFFPFLCPSAKQSDRERFAPVTILLLRSRKTSVSLKKPKSEFPTLLQIIFKTAAVILAVQQRLLSYNTCWWFLILGSENFSSPLHLPAPIVLVGSKSRGMLAFSADFLIGAGGTFYTCPGRKMIRGLTLSFC